MRESPRIMNKLSSYIADDYVQVRKSVVEPADKKEWAKPDKCQDTRQCHSCGEVGHL